jgi:hypothetical protein
MPTTARQQYFFLHSSSDVERLTHEHETKRSAGTGGTAREGQHEPGTSSSSGTLLPPSAACCLVAPETQLAQPASMTRADTGVSIAAVPTNANA